MRKMHIPTGNKPHIILCQDKMACTNIPHNRLDRHFGAMARYAYRLWPHGRVLTQVLPPSSSDPLSRPAVIVERRA